MSYWDETNNYLDSRGGRGPMCPRCGNEMFPQDDHGRFSCFCQGRMRTLDVVSGTTLNPKPIPETATEVKSEKKKSGRP